MDVETPSTGEPTRILYVDTDSEAAGRVAATVEADDDAFEVATESDPDAVLDELAETGVDCLVSGYDLSGTTGLELFDAVSEAHPTLPFILFPTDGNEAVASRAISAGVTDYVRHTGDAASCELLAERIREAVAGGRSSVGSGPRDMERLEQFSDVFPDVAFAVDEDGRYVDLLAGGGSSLLYDDVDALIGERFADRLPAETAGRFLDTVREALDTGERQRIEYRLDVKAGERWFEARVGPLGERDGRETAFWVARDITAAKRREREYERIFNEVDAAITVHDPDERSLVEVNETLAELTGYDRSTLREGGVELFSATDAGYGADRAYDIIESVAASGDDRTVEWRIETAAGERRWLDSRVTTATVGGEERVLGISQDITRRKRRQREYEQIFDSVNDAIVVFDPETGDILDVNETWCRMVGCDDLETIRDLGIEGFSATDDGYTGERGRALIAEAAERGDSETVEWRAETMGGDRLWLEATLTPAEIGGETRVLSIQRDVTAQKRRQREYEQIFDGVTDSIAVHDPETGELLDVNRTMCDLTGYDEATLRELGTDGLIIDDPAADYGPDDIAEIIDRVVGGEDLGPYEQVIETSDGDRVWLEVNPTRAVIGGERRFLAISRDVTDRRRREQRLDVFNRVLRHNLRNQVDVINSHAEVLDDRTDGDHAERIVESANTLATMGERARTIDRVLSGDVRERPVDLEACLGNAIRRVDQPDDVAIVATGVATGTAEVVTDRRVLLAVLESALENAAATAATRVEVTAERASDGWRLVIDPDGSGLPKAELNALAAGTETPLRHGRGLGLWQLKWGVEKISGRLSFDTDNGTTVRIGLPA